MCLIILPGIRAQAQDDWWRAQLRRHDGESIIFNFEWKKENNKDVWYIRNAAERLKVDNITIISDSIFVQMPVFESSFRIKNKGDSLTGTWIKRGAKKDQLMPFLALKGRTRFDSLSPSPKNVSGKWRATFDNDSSVLAVAEFEQHGNMVTGTFLHPTGDYRYLEGIVRNDSLLLSTFDGSHAYLFKAALTDSTATGVQYSGAASTERWRAVKDPTAAISIESVEMRLRPGRKSLHFSFPDIHGKTVSITDARFKHKVVLVQLMGSWCPNCMDETAYLSEYYRTNRQRGVEIVALTYEYTTDPQRSAVSVEKFRHRFDVDYPILLTGVAVGDSLRTEKTLPELTPIKVFPSLIIIDKKGKVRKIDTGFSGPATGAHYVQYRNELKHTVDELLRER